MLEFIIGFTIGMIFTFITILFGSMVIKEDNYEETKTSGKKKKS